MGSPLTMAALTTRAVVGASPSTGTAAETDWVRPEVKRLLTDLDIPYAREVKFDLLDASGNKVFHGYFDIVFRDPRSPVGALIVVETKGVDLDALTDNQLVYILKMESAEGANIRIKSRIGGAITLLYDEAVHINADNFVRVGTKNLDDFARTVAEIRAGAKFPYAAYTPSTGRRFFSTKEEADAFYRKLGVIMDPPSTPKWSRTVKVLGKGAAVLGIAGELLGPVEAAAQIDDLSAAEGDLLSTNIRKQFQIEHPTWIPLRDHRFYLDRKSGTLYQVLTDLQTLTAYGTARPIDVLSPYKIRGVVVPKEARLDTSNWWHSSATGATVFQDEDGSWKLERFAEPGMLDEMAETIRRIPYALTE